MEKINDIFLILAAMAKDLLAGIGLSQGLIYYVMIVIDLIIILGIVLLAALIGVYLERKISAYIQLRIGPNRVGPRGLLQTAADALKLLTKEDIIPREADKWVYILAPLLIFVPAIMVYAIVPFGEGMVAVDLNIGLFYFIAISSLTTIPLIMGGWASNNKYSLIGGMRAVAQMVSYEVPLVFSMLGVVMIVGSMQMSQIVAAQSKVWFVVLQPVAFLIYLIAATAEVNRTPFDLPEGESELTAGVFTEYTGMKFALFFLAEYSNLFIVSAIGATLFLGGWQGPILPGYVWFTLKTFFLIFVFMWARWTLPRFRVDQLMHFGWKVLLPLSLANIFVTGVGIYLYNMIGW